MAEDGFLSTGGQLAITALIIGEASGVFAGFCPSWFTVRSPFFHEQDAIEGNRKSIRAGEIAATLIVMGTGAAMTYMSKDPVPLIASAAISVIFIGGYEYSMAHPATDEKKVDITPDSVVNLTTHVVESAGTDIGLSALFAA